MLERGIGATPPRRMQIEFSRIVQQFADRTVVEVSPQGIGDLFRETYLEASGPIERVSATALRCADRNFAAPPAGADASQVAACIGRALGRPVTVADIDEQRLADGKTAVFVGIRMERPAVAPRRMFIATGPRSANPGNRRDRCGGRIGESRAGDGNDEQPRLRSRRLEPVTASVGRATRGLPRGEAPMGAFVNLDGRIGNLEQQGAAVGLEFDQRAPGDDAGVVACHEHICVWTSIWR